MAPSSEDKSMLVWARWVALYLSLIAAGGPAMAGGFGEDRIAGFYGDGSAGTLIINTDTDWTKNPPASTNLQFERVEVRASWTIPSGLTIKSRREFVVANGGSITVAPPPNTQLPFFSSVLGISLRLANIYQGGGIGVGPLQASQILRPGVFGGAAGVAGTVCSNGSGGGTLVLRVGKDLRVDGSIVAKGDDGVSCLIAAAFYPNFREGYGGSGGGFVVIAVGTLVAGNGTIDVSGGNGGAGQDDPGLSRGGPVYGVNGSGGGGGVIHVVAPFAPNTLQFVVNGGKAGTGQATGQNTADGYPGGASGGNGGGLIVGPYATNGYIQAGDGTPGFMIFTQEADPAVVFE